MRLYDIKKRYIDDSLRYYICETYSMNKFLSKETMLYKTRHLLERQAQILQEKGFIRDWKINMLFSDRAAKRDAMIDSLLHGTDGEVEEFIEASYQMTDHSIHSIRIGKNQLDSYVPAL